EDGIRFSHVTGVQTCALPIARAFWIFTRGGRSSRVDVTLGNGVERRGARGTRRDNADHGKSVGAKASAWWSHGRSWHRRSARPARAGRACYYRAPNAVDSAPRNRGQRWNPDKSAPA